MDTDLIYKIAISMIPGIGGVLSRTLIDYTGSVEGVFKESFKSLIKIPGIGEVNARRIKNSKILEQAEQEIEFMKKNNIEVLFYTDENFPNRLLNCADGPVLIYTKGEMNLDEQRIVSIVGTRNSTQYGNAICEELIKEFSRRNYNVLIISGLAYGIDIHAHRAALKYNLPTVGVIAHGMDKMYPSLHRDTAEKMLGNGGLVSDFPSNTRIDPPNFLRRNRIIAGLADATIVVESAAKGGALVTADIAFSYNRDVFAFPGRTGDTYSKGCNQLIRNNVASLIENVDDLEYFMGWENEPVKSPVQQSLFVELNKEEQKIVDLFEGQESLFVDQIAAESGFAINKVSALLMELEFKNVIALLPGNMYKLK